MHILLVFFLACGAVWLWGQGHWAVPLTLSLPYVPVGLLGVVAALSGGNTAVAALSVPVFIGGLLLIWTPWFIQRRRRTQTAAQTAHGMEILVPDRMKHPLQALPPWRPEAERQVAIYRAEPVAALADSVEPPGLLSQFAYFSAMAVPISLYILLFLLDCMTSR